MPSPLPSAAHEIIVNRDHQYVVWPARRQLPEGWRYLGRAGSREELELYLREMFVETLPTAALGTPRRRTRAQ